MARPAAARRLRRTILLLKEKDKKGSKNSRAAIHPKNQKTTA
jgi:hypothetical protein